MAASNNSVRVEHIEQAARILHTWSPSKIRMAKLQADSGSMMLVSDLCEDMIADDSIKGTLDIRVKGLFGLPLEFEPEGDKRKTSPVIKALTADWWKMNPEQALGQSWSWAIMLGVSVAELVIRENQGRVLPKLKHWHPRWLKFDWTTRAWMLNTQGGEVTLEAGNGKWMLFTPGGDHRPWANGAWRAVALWWLLKQYALTDWARYSEAHGKPILAGVMPATAQGDTNARKDLANDLGELGNDTSVALPPGYDLKLVEATANTWQTFKAQIEMADAGIAVAILGQNLTTRVSDGSRAAATVHNDVRSDLKRSARPHTSSRPCTGPNGILATATSHRGRYGTRVRPKTRNSRVKCTTRLVMRF
jgi:phage gp29-like protein